MENLKKQEAFFQKCLHLELENDTNCLCIAALPYWSLAEEELEFSNFDHT